MAIECNAMACFQKHYVIAGQLLNVTPSATPLLVSNMLYRYFKKGSELALGTGAFVAGLEFSGDCKAEVVGKPSKTFFDLAVARFDGIASEEILMVGDDIRDDVIGMKIVENDH